MTYQDSIARAMAITGAFEGAWYGTLSDAGDGQGWSAGVLQWNMGQETLQPLILAMHKGAPETFAACMTQSGEKLGPSLLDACKLPIEAAVAWCHEREYMGRPLPEWLAAFRALGSTGAFQAIERAHAAQYAGHAIAMFEKYRLISDRGYALCFDIAVQMGSISAWSHQRFEAEGGIALPEFIRLAAMARAVGPQGGVWANDVVARKMAIATGHGAVHGKTYDLEAEYGLTLGPAVLPRDLFNGYVSL